MAIETAQNVGADLRRVIAKYGYNKGLSVEFGFVTSVNPLGILLDGSDVELSAKDLSVSEHLTSRKVSVLIDGVEREIIYPSVLERADRVMVARDEEASLFFVVDKVADEGAF